MPRRVRVEGYTVLRELGSGRTGTTYLAVETTGGRPRANGAGHGLVGGRRSVAIKAIERGSKVSDNIEREVIIHRRLNHPHIVQLYEVALTEAYLALVMEACRGGDLFEFLAARRKWVTEDKMWRFFYELLLAVHYLHRLDIYHRDIKPENILVTGTDLYSEPVLKLCDFGLAQECIVGEIISGVGTTNYVAPEVFKLEDDDGDQKSADCDLAAADVWSCGVVFYAIVTGKLPFQDPNSEKSTAKEVFSRIIACQWSPPPPGCSPEMIDIFSRIFVLDPSSRPSVDELIGICEAHVDVETQRKRALECFFPRDSFPQSEQECLRLVEEARTAPLRSQRSHLSLPSSRDSSLHGKDFHSAHPDLFSSLLASMSPTTSPSVSRVQSVQQDLQSLGQGANGIVRGPTAARSSKRAPLPRTATEGTDLEGLFARGRAFETGDGGSQSFEEAVRWYRVAAEGGHPKAQYSLGGCYESGVGVNQDPKAAQRWYRLAASAGHQGARLRLDEESEHTSDADEMNQVQEKIGSVSLHGGP